MDSYEEVMDEFPDDTSTSMMQDFVNKNLDDTRKTYLDKVNDIGVDKQVG